MKSRFFYNLKSFIIYISQPTESVGNSDGPNPLDSPSLKFFYCWQKIPINRLLPTHLSSTTMCRDYPLVNVYSDNVYQLGKL